MIKKYFTSVVLFATLSVTLPDAYGFDLKSFEGKKTKFESLIGNGKWTLIMFWAHHCSICLSEVNVLSDFHDERHQNDAQVIGISIDGEEQIGEALKFVNKSKPTFPVYIGELELIAFNYQLMTQESFRGTPTFVLFGPDGSVMANNPGPFAIDKLEKFIARYTAPQ